MSRNITSLEPLLTPRLLPTGSESPQADRKFQVPALDLDEMASDIGADMATGIACVLSKEELRQNEISAPYEAPQFPIEQIEDKLKLQRRFSHM